jgi:hypothetical protein
VDTAETTVLVPAWVLYHLTHWQREKKTGCLKLNFHDGTIGSINVEERVVNSRTNR